MGLENDKPPRDKLFPRDGLNKQFTPETREHSQKQQHFVPGLLTDNVCKLRTREFRIPHLKNTQPKISCQKFP